MPLSNADLTLIEERASNLAERLSGKYVPIGAGGSNCAIRLARWKQLASGNVPQRFAEMLGSMGKAHVTEADLLAMLGQVTRQREAPEPEWVSFLHEITVATSNAHATGGEKAAIRELHSGTDEHVPYSQLYQPICDLAWARVSSFNPLGAGLLSPKARRGLQGSLLHRLSSIASPALHYVFLVHKSFHESGTAQHVFGVSAATNAGETDDGRRIYKSFVAEQGTDGLSAFFRRYSVAARLMAEVTLMWVQFVREFLQRLQSDQTKLATCFDEGRTAGTVVAIASGVSDPHNGGRSVLILTLRSGTRIVYKPRSMEIDRLFFDLLGELNVLTMSRGLRVLKVLTRGEYGWMEFVRHTPSIDRHVASKFYERAGSLACLLHWLQGIDNHHENLVASGEYPVLVDLECLAHPLGQTELPLGDGATPWNIASSVLRTGLLPLWSRRPLDSTLYDNSGLGAPLSQCSLIPAIRWFNVNTDGMHFKEVQRRVHRPTHHPQFTMGRLALLAFESEILEGYQRMASLLEGLHAIEFCAWRGLIYRAIRRHVRRPTLIYSALSKRSLEPGCLAVGVDRSIELYALPCQGGDEAQRSDEITSMERMDIPYFRVDLSDSNALAHEQNSAGKPHLHNQREVITLSLRRRLLLEEEKITRLGPDNRR